MAGCNGDCEHCASAEGCESKNVKAVLNDQSHIKKIICVLSGKGGVGKTFVTSSLAVYLNRAGLSVGILDADFTGPSIPKSFGIKDKAYGENNLIYPLESKGGIKVMSVNCLLEDETDPVVWRGPLFGGLLKQFYGDVLWGDLDVLLIDMPPGTSDMALNVFQLLPVDEMIMVTSPQDLVNLIVTKALKMSKMLNIHTLGVIENMSYLECPKCQEHISVFGESHLEEFAKANDLDVLARLPIKPENTKLVDMGKVESILLPEIQECVDKIIKEVK
ncbi:MAG: Mrp/NBP35 family ATP-binding protein [Bacilli bacterium]|nr:Mrp/NBP35 family ATP-binding protein [Bacilli bacterium]